MPEVLEEERTLTRSIGGVRLRSEVAVAEDGELVELRGILESLSNRFWSGWGFGVLTTDRGQIKITGALEGHVAGTSLIVRGAFKETAYGRQLDCSSIVVDSVSGDLTVIRSWAKKACPDFVDDVVRLMRVFPVES